MIARRSRREIEAMRAAGRIVAEVLALMAEHAVPGVTTGELDHLAEDHILRYNGIPLFKGYRGFPATICASVNDEVVHGIPGERRLVNGDIVSVDVGVRLGKYCADAAVTLSIGHVNAAAQRLIDNCREALAAAIGRVRPAARLSEVCRAVQQYAESRGCGVVRQYTGHGIGREMHEEPQVPNFVAEGMCDPALREGMVLAIEPMLNAGGAEVRVQPDKWTVVTADGSLSAHFEHTVAVTAEGHEVLTQLSAVQR